MIISSIVIFAAAAIFGLILLAKLLAKKSLPRPVVYTHGFFAATGLIVLLVYAFRYPDNYPFVSLIFFIVAALGGFILFYNDVRKKTGPVALAIIHGLAAVVAFLLLIVFALG